MDSPPALSVLYAPKGPLLDWSNESLRQRVLDDLQSFAKKQGAIFLKMDPDVVLGTGIPGADGAVEGSGGADVQSELTRRGWVYSSDQIQFRNTVLIDLQPTEEEMLARMKQKTRYNVRLAEKKGCHGPRRHDGRSAHALQDVRGNLRARWVCHPR